MNEKTESQNDENTAAGRESDKQLARRRLLKAGVSAAPVVLTLVSRPVLAWHCKPPSAYASANLSQRVQRTWTDDGTKTIYEWVQYSPWPSPYVKSGYWNGWQWLNATTMAGAGLGSSGETMLSRLQQGSSLEKHVIAALLNIAYGKVPGDCLTVSELQKMFIYGQNGTYVPPNSPGIKWGSTEIVQYLYDNWVVRG
jgi:hypothetical protein